MASPRKLACFFSSRRFATDVLGSSLQGLSLWQMWWVGFFEGPLEPPHCYLTGRHGPDFALSSPYKPLHCVASHGLLLLKNLLHFHRVMISSQHAPVYNICSIYATGPRQGTWCEYGPLPWQFSPVLLISDWVGSAPGQVCCLKRNRWKMSLLFLMGIPKFMSPPTERDRASHYRPHPDQLMKERTPKAPHPPLLPSVVLRLGGVDGSRVGWLHCCGFWREASDTDC